MYPVALLVGILFESFLREDTKITNATIGLILTVHQHVTLGEVTLGVLLLLRDTTAILCLLTL